MNLSGSFTSSQYETSSQFQIPFYKPFMSQMDPTDIQGVWSSLDVIFSNLSRSKQSTGWCVCTPAAQAWCYLNNFLNDWVALLAFIGDKVTENGLRVKERGGEAGSRTWVSHTKTEAYRQGRLLNQVSCSKNSCSFQLRLLCKSHLIQQLETQISDTTTGLHDDNVGF